MLKKRDGERESRSGCRNGERKSSLKTEFFVQMSTQRLAKSIRCPTSREENVVLCKALSLYMRRKDPFCFIAIRFLVPNIFFKPFFQ